MVIGDRLLGLFPVNGVVTFLHLMIGFWGLFSWSGATSSVSYARGLALFMGALALLALFATFNVPLELVPVRGYDALLYGVTAGLGAYFGYRSAARRERHAERRKTAMDRRHASRPVAFERRNGGDRRHGVSATLAAE